MPCRRGVSAILCLIVLSLRPLAAQENISGGPQVRLALARLNTLGSVLMIGAHPDDEHTDTLAYFARGRALRTGYLSLTRGEGGQNLIGSEQGELLGVIRTQELLGRAPHRRRRAILHARHRLRLLENTRGDPRQVGTASGYFPISSG